MILREKIISWWRPATHAKRWKRRSINCMARRNPVMLQSTYGTHSSLEAAIRLRMAREVAGLNNRSTRNCWPVSEDLIGNDCSADRRDQELHLEDNSKAHRSEIHQLEIEKRFFFKKKKFFFLFVLTLVWSGHSVGLWLIIRIIRLIWAY